MDRGSRLTLEILRARAERCEDSTVWHGYYERNRDDGASGQRVENTQDYKFARQHRPREPGSLKLSRSQAQPYVFGSLLHSATYPVFLGLPGKWRTMRTGARRRCTLITAGSPHYCPLFQTMSLAIFFPRKNCRCLLRIEHISTDWKCP